MELITLCGLVIVVIGFGVECELAAKSVTKMILSRRFFQEHHSRSVRQKNISVRRMPVCFADWDSKTDCCPALRTGSGRFVAG